MKSDRRGLFLVFAVLLFSAALGAIYGPRVRATARPMDETQTAIRDFTRVLDVVQANYAQPVDVDKLVYEGAIPGMMRVLDPHSFFLDARQWALSMEDRRGKYFGVGMGVVPRGNRTVVMTPYVGTPAFKAGLKPGDIIETINDKSVEGKTTQEISDMLRGTRGTLVKITVTREGYPEPLIFSVTRDEIPHHSVDLAFEVRPGIGYIRFSGFNEIADKELAEAMNQLRSSTLDGLILDMRGNPGGLLNEAIAAADMFLDKNQLIVSHHGRASEERRFYAVRGNRGNTVPLVVMVNNNSASAAEIVAGAVQDHDRGVIVGETTFGKGLVQTYQPLSEGTGLALTVARYYTPSGRLIQRDYKSVSLYAYHYERKVPEHPSEVRLTDSGRQVTGGGGITPDVTVHTPQLNRFQTMLLREEVLFPGENSVGDFPRHFLAARPTVTKDFKVDDALINDFRKFLAGKNIRYSEVDFADNLEWTKRKIQQEVILSAFGQQEEEKVELASDLQLLAAIDAIPQARALYQTARKIIAERTGSPTFRP